MRTLFSLFLITATTCLHAQFTLSGEYRPRLEVRDGYQLLPETETNPAFFVSQRLRLSFQYAKDIYTLRITPQEARVWGDKKLKSDQNSLGIYEGWLEMKLCESFRLRLGRQELVYDNQRLLSNNNWRQTGQGHDALVLKFIQKGWQLDLGGAFNQAKENSSGTSYDNTLEAFKGNYKSLAFLYGSKKAGKVTVAVTSITDGYQKAGTTATDYYRITNGGSLQYESEKAGFAVRAFYQSGMNQAGKEISAYYLNPEIKYRVFKPLTLTAGLDYISGNDHTDTTDTKFRTFSMLYGSGHQFNGNIDHFTDMPRDTKESGLIDAYLKAGFKTSDKMAFHFDFHYFALGNKFVYVKEEEKITAEAYLGSEVDFNLQYNFHKDITLLAGYSLMLGTESLVQLQGGNRDETAHFFWTALVVKPTLFSNGK